MKHLKRNILYLCLCLFGISELMAQSLVDDASLTAGNAEGAFNETIKVISSSKKIFIITNNNQQLGPGDFCSLALDNKLAARALVAKTHQGQVGIKILKIYSLAQWGKLRRDQEVQVVKGDDSNFGAAPVAAAPEAAPKIKNEEDLFTGDVVLEDELADFDDNKNRHIKPDNLVTLFAGFYDVAEVEEDGGVIRTQELGFTWGYQFADNYFFEGGYGRAQLNSFPCDGCSTLVNHIMGRLKFNIKGPLYTFFMPYVGFQTYSVVSPDAGVGDNDQLNQTQLEAVQALKESGPTFGVTILRRLVPGWFIKADIGTDLINAGFAIEF
ncbi:MAG TPA: hypothetical protein VNJ08_10050 [Bacteriovoracaceae bacterium]|nr:hypothetical protein [Bacteriovoracaceae bacterium]